MNEPPAAWYVARLLDAAANHLAALEAVDPDRDVTADLVVRLRDASAELRIVDVR